MNKEIIQRLRSKLTLHAIQVELKNGYALSPLALKAEPARTAGPREILP